MGASDIVVVGGGVMGCAIALRLAQRGVKVTVLERSIPGAEASSAAGGILAPQMESDRPGPMLDLCLRSRALYPEFSRELAELSGVDIHYVPSGVLHVAFNEAELRKLETTVAWQREAGLRASLLSAKEAQELEPSLSPRALGAAHFPDDHQVDNRLLVRALSMSAARVGAKFRTGYVRGLLTEGERAIGVDVDGEHVLADAVIVAAGSWSGLVNGVRIDPRIVRPARGQMLELQARLPPFERILFSDHGYLIPRKDGRVLAGSTLEFTGFEKQVTAAGMHRILNMTLELCPSLGSLEVTGFWAGLRPYTEDHAPILGPGPLKQLFLATGHFRNGILLAPITARVVADCVLGERPSLELGPFLYDRRVAMG